LGGLVPEGALDLNVSASNAVPGNGLLGINFTKLTGTPFELVNAELSASESKGTIKIISAPRILTLDNKSALIKQGIAYPLTKLDADGNTTTEFQDVALELTVTPHVTPDNRITLSIQITNNELGPLVNGETSFTSKEAKTELLVNDGDTVVIGGIRKTTQRDSQAGLPVLMEIPLLSWMFKQSTKSDDLEELLIFITPKIVMLEQRI
jgi:type IV pilus assembly protein PilQ